MNPTQPPIQQNIDLIKFDEVEIIKKNNNQTDNNPINNSKNNNINNRENIFEGKKLTYEKINEESEKKELNDSSGEIDKKREIMKKKTKKLNQFQLITLKKMKENQL